MLILVATLLALAAVPLLGGRLSLLSGLQLRGGRWVATALGTQVLVISIVPHWPRTLLVPLHALSYVLAAVVLWQNRRLPGLPLIALGGGLNATAIAVNRGQMPGDPGAFAQAGITSDSGFVNSGVLDGPRLAALGDVFASPSWLPLQNVYSVGDLLILAGAVWAVHRTCRTVLGRRTPAHLLRRRRSAAAGCTGSAPLGDPAW